MHHKHRWVNASLSQPMPWGSNCFYLWWVPNHVWWGPWVVPCVPACKKVNGWGLIAINCACVAFALMQKAWWSCRLFDGADSSDWLPLQHMTACVKATRLGQMWTIIVIVLLLTSYTSPSLISVLSWYSGWCGLLGFKLIPFSVKSDKLQHRAQLHCECSAGIGQNTDCNDCFTPKFASIEHVWLPKSPEQQIKQRKRKINCFYPFFPVPCGQSVQHISQCAVKATFFFFRKLSIFITITLPS